ncbi:MAG: SseB family protein [Lachnospiraceae bacterium]|nr:SseB family protein [Lachnospiraceae bacterium]
MELNKTVSNPMLVGVMQLIKADGKTPDPKHQEMFMEELDKAEFLAPAEVKAEVGPDGEKLVNGKAQFRFPILTGSDGRRFFVAFTDNATVAKAQQMEGASALPEEFVKETVAVRFSDLARFILTPNPDGSENTTYGIVINPFMENIVIPKNLVAAIVMKKQKEARERLEKAGKVASIISGGVDPKVIPFPGGKDENKG